MFTGIVKGRAKVASVERKSGLVTFQLDFPVGYGTGLELGASVSISGVCLTAVHVGGDQVSFDIIEETLLRTTLGSIREGSEVNIERSYRVGDEIGGHVLSGHVLGTAEIVSVEKPENNHILTFRVSNEWMKYLLPKGFVALDGCSLTIVETDRESATFSVCLIPETLRLTTFEAKCPGDRVNLEIDSKTQAIVDTVEAYLKEHEISQLFAG